MQCREISELLSPYLDGVLDPSKGEDISAHLAVCPDCLEEWRALCEVVELFKTLPEVTPPPELRAKVINTIAASSLPALQKPGLGSFFRNVTWGHRFRVFAFAATVVFTVGITALMYGTPGSWGTKNLFLPQPSSNQKVIQDNFEKNNNPSPDFSNPDGTFKGSGTDSDTARNDRTDVVDNRLPDRIDPVTGVDNVLSPPANLQPERPDIIQDPSNEKNTKYMDQLNSLLDEQAHGDNGFPSSTGALAAPQAMAIKEGAISQQAAFGYIPVSSKESLKMVRSASLDLTVDNPAEAQVRIAEIARSNGGTLLEGDFDGGAITMKVPADRFKQAVNSIQEMGRATLRQIGAEDVSEKYSDYEARLRSLAAKEQKLLTEADNAGSATTTDAQTAQAKLAKVREDMERQKELISNLSNKVEMATIKIDLH